MMKIGIQNIRNRKRMELVVIQKLKKESKKSNYKLIILIHSLVLVIRATIQIQ